MTYTLLGTNAVLRSDGAIIPDDAGNVDWQAYQTWLAAGNTPTPQGLSEAQSAQVASLSAACSAAIGSGFQSSALGAPYAYPSQPLDQSNLVGAAAASQRPGLPSTWSCNFWCADGSGTWALRPHTAAQIQQVLADGLAAREALSTRLDGLVAQVRAAATVGAVQAVVWG